MKTTASAVDASAVCLLAGVVAGLTLCGARGARHHLDPRGEVRLGLRSYVAVRIGTNRIGGDSNPLNWPESGAGHLRQNRFFVQLSYDHDLTRLVKESWGLLAPFRLIDPTTLKYTLEYRFEGEGVYDWGPDEYSKPGRVQERFRGDFPNVNHPGRRQHQHHPSSSGAYIKERTDRLRRNARVRNRLFLAYLDFEKGPFFLRLGRQILAWGETDVFRLLDNINPLDDSFGGFFIALDERRVPIAMARGSWQLGSKGPFQDAYVEGFVGAGQPRRHQPGHPGGLSVVAGRHRAPEPGDPAGSRHARFRRRARRRAPRLHRARHHVQPRPLLHVSRRARHAVPHPRPGQRLEHGELHNPILAFQRFPRVAITGGSATFPLTKFYSIVRAEMAYFRGQPFSRQGKGDTFDAFDLGTGAGTPGTKRLRSFNNTEGGVNPFVYPRFLADRPAGARVGQRPAAQHVQHVARPRRQSLHPSLNPTQTFFISTQFFYKHIFDSPGDLVLPVPFRNLPVDPRIAGHRQSRRRRPLAALGGGCGPKTGAENPPAACATGRAPASSTRASSRNGTIRFLQTFLITTAYSGGRIVPSFGVFYDWVGGWVFQPGVTLVRDPFRFTMDYTSISAVAAQQFGAVRDKDNVRFQVEYVF